MYDGNVTRVLLDGTVTRVNGQVFLSGKGLAGERMPRVAWVEPHGHTSRPVAGGIATVVQARGNRDSVYALGGANPDLVPDIGPGGSAIYDHLGNVVSVVQNTIRLVAAEGIRMSAPLFLLDGEVHLGGEEGSRVLTEDGPSSKVRARL